MARFKIVSVFLLTVLAAVIFWNTLLRAWAAANPDSRLAQAFVGAGVA